MFDTYHERRVPPPELRRARVAVFAVFAAVWVAFSVAGLALGADRTLRDALIGILNTSVPGLIGEAGAIDPAALFSTPALGWTGAIALVGTLWTAVGWLGSARDAVRDLAGLPAPTTSFVLLKLKDLGLALAFGVALVVSELVSVMKLSEKPVADLVAVDSTFANEVLEVASAPLFAVSESTSTSVSPAGSVSVSVAAGVVPCGTVTTAV